MFHTSKKESLCKPTTCNFFWLCTKEGLPSSPHSSEFCKLSGVRRTLKKHRNIIYHVAFLPATFELTVLQTVEEERVFRGIIWWGDRERQGHTEEMLVFQRKPLRVTGIPPPLIQEVAVTYIRDCTSVSMSAF